MHASGDYIYLIVVVIAILSSFLKKKKNTATTDQKPDRDIEDILKDFIPEKEPTQSASSQTSSQENVKPAYQTVTQPVYETFDNSTNFEDLKAKKEVTKHHTHIHATETHLYAEEEQTTVEEYENSIRFNSIEDAKKAFIYAEIFNRKY